MVEIYEEMIEIEKHLILLKSQITGQNEEISKTNKIIDKLQTHHKNEYNSLQELIFSRYNAKQEINHILDEIENFENSSDFDNETDEEATILRVADANHNQPQQLSTSNNTPNGSSDEICQRKRSATHVDFLGESTSKKPNTDAPQSSNGTALSVQNKTFSLSLGKKLEHRVMEIQLNKLGVLVFGKMGCLASIENNVPIEYQGHGDNSIVRFAHFFRYEKEIYLVSCSQSPRNLVLIHIKENPSTPSFHLVLPAQFVSGSFRKFPYNGQIVNRLFLCLDNHSVYSIDLESLFIVHLFNLPVAEPLPKILSLAISTVTTANFIFTLHNLVKFYSTSKTELAIFNDEILKSKWICSNLLVFSHNCLKIIDVVAQRILQEKTFLVDIVDVVGNNTTLFVGFCDKTVKTFTCEGSDFNFDCGEQFVDFAADISCMSLKGSTLAVLDLFY